MNKKIKKFAVGLITSAMCLTSGLGTISANAAEGNVFAFNLGLGGSDFSTPASQLNYLSYATVTPTSGSLSSTSFLFVTIYSADKTTQLASSVKLTELNKQVRVYYNTTTPSYGTQVRLKGNAGYYGVTVAGGWTP